MNLLFQVLPVIGSMEYNISGSEVMASLTGIQNSFHTILSFLGVFGGKVDVVGSMNTQFDSQILCNLSTLLCKFIPHLYSPYKFHFHCLELLLLNELYPLQCSKARGTSRTEFYHNHIIASRISLPFP